jgi:hypothetical protein
MFKIKPGYLPGFFIGFRVERFAVEEALCFGPLLTAAPTARSKRSQPSGLSSISGSALGFCFFATIPES